MVRRVQSMTVIHMMIESLKYEIKNEQYYLWSNEEWTSINERVSKEEVKDLVESLDLIFLKEVNINEEHYGLIFKA